MGIPIIGDLIEELGKTARQVLPNNEARLAFDAKLAEFADRAQQRIHEQLQGQVEVNKVEAAHASIFVAGWRPGMGWVGVVGAAIAFVIVPVCSMLQAWWGGKPIPAYDVSQLMVLVTGMLGFAGVRSFDKVKGVAREAIALPMPATAAPPSPAPAPTPRRRRFRIKI